MRPRSAHEVKGFAKIFPLRETVLLLAQAIPQPRRRVPFGRNQTPRPCVRQVMMQEGAATAGFSRAVPSSGWLVRRLATRATGTAVLVAAVFVLAACGSAVSGRDPGLSRPVSAADSTLCGSVASLDRLVVERSDAFPQNHMRFTFPAEVTVTDATPVSAAARALCALPKMPSGTFHCPADLGIVYHLAFSVGGRAFPTVEVEATGCQRVHGLGAVRWVARSPGFWPTLGRAMGLSSPSYATFRGSGPNG